MPDQNWANPSAAEARIILHDAPDCRPDWYRGHKPPHPGDAEASQLAMLETESTGKEMIKISGGVRMMLVGLAAIVLLLAACSGEDSSVSLPEGVTLPESAPEVDAPDPTQAEAPAAADDEVPVCV
jgi:hypothetical protein